MRSAAALRSVCAKPAWTNSKGHNCASRGVMTTSVGTGHAAAGDPLQHDIDSVCHDIEQARHLITQTNNLASNSRF